MRKLGRVGQDLAWIYSIRQILIEKREGKPSSRITSISHWALTIHLSMTMTASISVIHYHILIHSYWKICAGLRNSRNVNDSYNDRLYAIPWQEIDAKCWPLLTGQHNLKVLRRRLFSYQQEFTLVKLVHHGSCKAFWRSWFKTLQRWKLFETHMFLKLFQCWTLMEWFMETT